MNVTINFGRSNMVRREFPEGTTVGQVLSDQGARACLGFGDNAVAKIDGVTQSNEKRLVDGDVLDLEVRANQKA